MKKPSRRKPPSAPAPAPEIAEDGLPPLPPERHPETLGERLRELDPRRFFLEAWDRIDAEVARERAAEPDSGTRYWPTILALALGAVCLTVMDNEYWGGRDAYHAFVPWLTEHAWFRSLVAARFVEGGGVHTSPGDLYDALERARYFTLGGHAWWAGWRVIGYFLLPALIVKVVLKGRLRDYGLETKGFSQHVWLYVTLFSIVLVAVVAVSFTDEFSSYYPFYKKAKRSWFDFLSWEVLYAAQFFSLEFFFRGFFLKACRRSMGSYAIFAMIVPYCMIHFGKPMAETLGAIFAGIVLGTLAMRTRSIWSGFLIHVSVALSMDIAALLQTAHLPRGFWP